MIKSFFLQSNNRIPGIKKYIFFITCLLLVSCKPYQKTVPYFEIKNGHAYVSPEMAQQIQKYKNDFPVSDLELGVIPFTRTSPIYHNNLFVHIVLGDTPYLFMLDTGMPYSILYTAPSSIMKGDSFGSIGSTSCVIQVGDNPFVLNFRMTPDSTYEFGIDNVSETGIDGILGINFFEKLDNVVFDYGKNVMLLNQPPISSIALPVMHTAGFGVLRPLLQITVDGVNEIGLIDTGAYTVVLREEFGDGNSEFPLAELNKTWNEKKPVTLAQNRNRFLKNVQIGDVILQNVSATYWNSENIITNDWARRTTEYVNFFGIDMWQGHIIQLDFRNDLFRIK